MDKTVTFETIRTIVDNPELKHALDNACAATARDMADALRERLPDHAAEIEAALQEVLPDIAHAAPPR